MTMSLFRTRPFILRQLPVFTTGIAIQPSNRSPFAVKMSNTTSNKKNYSSIPTPETCYADFCLVPIGTGSVSVAKEVAEIQKLLAAASPRVAHTLHSAGTTLEGSWDDVMRVIGQAHSLVHQGGVVRVQTSMRVGTRTDKKQTAEEKVKRVQDILAEDKD